MARSSSMPGSTPGRPQAGPCGAVATEGSTAQRKAGTVLEPVARMVVSGSMPTRTLNPGPGVAERALVIDPGQRIPGRAAGFPLRREGPAKLTGTAKYTDDLVFPGAWYGITIRSTEARARLIAIEPDPDVDWSKVVIATAADIPGDNIVASIKDDQPVLVPIGGEVR